MPGLARGESSRRGGGRLAALALATGILTASCGGGGGGEDGGGGGGSAYSLSSSSVSFSATLGGPAPAPQAVTVTADSGSVFIATSQSGGNFSHTFTLTGPATGQILITPGGTSTAGTFVGQITIRGCSSPTCDGSDVPGSPKTIDVTYTVSGPPILTSNVPSVDFTTLTGAIPAARNLNLGMSSGSSAWTSQIDYLTPANGWLDVSPTSGGSLPQVITLSVLPAGVAAAGTHTATVTFTAGALTKVVPVSLTVSDPTVNFVSPYVGTTGVAGNVIIRGFGFASAGLTVDFGGNAATSTTFVSGTEIRATYPALAAGTYAVNVGNGGPPLTTRAQLKLLVVNPPAFPAATIARQNNPGSVGRLIYDAERQRLYLLDGERGRLETYRFTGVDWVLEPTLVNAPSPYPIVLAPDGSELLMPSGFTMLRIDPATLAVTPVDALPFLGTGGSHLGRIAFTNDGGAVGGAYAPLAGISLYRYDMLTQQFSALSTQFDMVNRTIEASGNGSVVVLPTSEPLIPSFAKPVFTYEASAGTLNQRALLTTGTAFAALSRDGSRIVLVNDHGFPSEATVVYDYNGSSFSVRGSLPSPVNGLTLAPDGATAYAYYSASGTIRKFDLNGPNGSGGFTETGSVAVASPGDFARMAISPDGGTLFLAGKERLIVSPAP